MNHQQDSSVAVPIRQIVRRGAGAAALAAALAFGGGGASAQTPQAGPDAVPGPEAQVFDMHVHIGDGERTVLAYLEQSAAAGPDVTRFGGMLMASQGDPEGTRRRNDELIALAVKYPAMTAIASVHPYDGPAALAELDRIAALGVSAIKIHPLSQRFEVTDPRVVDLCVRAGELGVVIIIDNASILPGDNQNLFALALRCRETTFVFTHMGGLEFRFWNTLPLVRTAGGFFADNIHFDISAVVNLVADTPLEEEFVWTLRNIGVDRILLGSDYPQMSLAQAVDALDRLDLEPAEKHRILYENARALFAPGTP